MSYKIIIDRDVCIGAASCVVAAEKVFAMDNENKAVVVDATGSDAKTILLAAKVCPTLAIAIIDEATGKQIWPHPSTSSG